jgi:hypothetical protein
MGSAARELAVCKHSLEVATDRLEAILRDVIAEEAA